MNEIDPYDELPYRSRPIEWTAPERLVLASLLHGGPRVPLDGYRVLELGCAEGANLLPMAYYRRHATFVGVDGSGSAIAVAERRRADLGIGNLELIYADSREIAGSVTGQFDFILAHGVLSWVVPDEVRDGLLSFCNRALRPGGLFYFNYNTRPGWDVRGLVRGFLVVQTAGTVGLAARAEQAREVAAKLSAALAAGEEHPYSRLMQRELQFVCDHDPSYIAHEYLTAHNRAYWRSEMLALLRGYGLSHVADADFNYPSGRVDQGLPEKLAAERIVGRTLDDTVDLLSYRQLCSPIVTRDPWTPEPPSAEEIADLVVVSCLAPIERAEEARAVDDGAASGPIPRALARAYRHPTGYEVDVREQAMSEALDRLVATWPRGVRAGALFPEPGAVVDDLRLLHRHGLVELRLIEPGDFAAPPGPLAERERRWGAYATTPYHTREDTPS